MDFDWKWMFIAVIAIFAIGGVGMYFEQQAARAREHEAHLERMEMLKLGLVPDGGVR